jgi:microcystin-dependent protein
MPQPDVRQLAEDLARLRDRLDALQMGITPSGGGWEDPKAAAPCGWEVGDLKFRGATGDHTTDGYEWLYCNGRSLLRADYPALFTAIGTTFGAADGTHFNVPDALNRYLLGTGTGKAIGANEGIATADEATRSPDSHTHDPAALKGTVAKSDLAHNHGGSVSTIIGHTSVSGDASAQATGDAASTGMGPYKNFGDGGSLDGHNHPIPADAFQHHTHAWTQDSGGSIASWTPAADLVVTIGLKNDPAYEEFHKKNWPPHLALPVFILAKKP